MPPVDPAVAQAIREFPSGDVTEIGRALLERFGDVVPSGVIMQVRGSLNKSPDLDKARQKAGAVFSDKVGVIEQMGTRLQEMFNDESLPHKQRMEVSKELRAWLRLGLDAAVGEVGSGADITLIIDSRWDMSPKLEPESKVIDAVTEEK